MLSSLNKISKIILLVSSFALFCSCTSSKSDKVNSNFLKQYGDHIEKINSQRDEMRMSGEQKQSDKNLKDPEIPNIENSESSESALIDNSQTATFKTKQDFLPNGDTLLQNQVRQFPEDMFLVNYNMQNFPDSYGRSRLSFDDITIPSRDAFGVETDLGEKNYQLINHKILQRDIDFAKQLSGKEDREISSQLIEEEKQAKRKKYLSQKAGNKVVDKADDKKADSKAEPDNIKKADDKAEPDNIKKADKKVSTEPTIITNQIAKQK